jgi:hypothetical protein
MNTSLHVALYVSAGLAAFALGCLIATALEWISRATQTHRQSQPVETGPVRADQAHRRTRNRNATRDLADGVSVERVNSSQP